MAIQNITEDESKDKYGITSEHSIMPSGELRFRLKKDDGTSYIRTESPAGGVWQQAHYHNQVRETYIVQNGWIGYAELIENKPYFKIYKENWGFTTKPFTIHNIYMPKDAVIHTVKHGNSKDEKRLIDNKTKEFTEFTSKISESELKKIAITKISKNEPAQKIYDYNEPYRHFDNLIWQVPAWSSGIFTAMLVGMGDLQEKDVLLTMSGFKTKTLLCLLYGIVGVFIFFLSHALYRFRWHQARVKNYKAKFHLLSPQVGLQLIVNIQLIFLLFLSTSFIDNHLTLKLSLAILLFITIMTYQERRLSKEEKNNTNIEITRS